MNTLQKTVAAIVLALAALAGVGMAQEAVKPQWESVAGNIFAAKGVGGGRLVFGVDRTSGQLFANCGAAVVVSADGGQTFSRLGFEAQGPATAVSANSIGSLWVSPDGGRLAVFNAHSGNKPGSGCSTDGGKTWRLFGNNWDWGVMGCDSDSLLGVTGGKGASVFFSPDAGKTWTAQKLTDVSGVGIFGATELVVSHNDGKVERSDDAGKTWKPVATGSGAGYACAGPLQVFKGVGYWLARNVDAKLKTYCILTSKDKGATWQELCALPSMPSGIPMFGKSEKDMVVATVKGILQTSDAGANWKLVAAYPEEMPESVYGQVSKRGKPIVNTFDQLDRSVAYDPVHEVLYLGATTWQGPQKYLRLSLKSDAPPAPSKSRWTDLTPVCNAQTKSSNTVHGGGPTIHLRNVAVDRASGNLFVGDGPIAVSSDGGKSFVQATDDPGAGTYFGCGGWGLQADSRGGRIFSCGMTNDHVRAAAYSLDGGKTWEKVATSANGHGIWGVADLASKTILMYGNEGEHFWGSTDLGKAWTTIKQEIIGAGIFSDHEWVVSKPTGGRGAGLAGQIERSEDSGKTWAKVADYACLGPMKILKGVGYWTAPKDDKHWVVITTKDKGKTWQELGVPFEEDATINIGPILGKDENHLFVMTWWGILETTDAGAYWKMAAPFEGEGPRMDGGNLGSYLLGGSMPSADYDPVHDALYFANGGNVWVPGSGSIWKFQR